MSRTATPDTRRALRAAIGDGTQAAWAREACNRTRDMVKSEMSRLSETGRFLFPKCEYLVVNLPPLSWANAPSVSLDNLQDSGGSFASYEVLTC